MGKGHKRRKTGETANGSQAALLLPSVGEPPIWTSVAVGLPEPDEGGNHYDDSDCDDENRRISSLKKRRQSAKTDVDNRDDNDLEAQPGEDVALFYGLEVLNANHYKVQRSDDGCRLVIVPNVPLTNTALEKLTVDDDDDDSTIVDRPSPPKGLKEEHGKLKKKNKKKIKKAKRALEAQCVKDSVVAAAAAAAAAVAESRSSTPKNSSHEIDNTATTAATSKAVDFTTTAVDTTRSVWCVATGGVLLHPTLCRSLHQQGFLLGPTPIQAAALAASILGRRNIVGAAPTGSGKVGCCCCFFISFVLVVVVGHGSTLSLSRGATPMAARTTPWEDLLNLVFNLFVRGSLGIDVIVSTTDFPAFAGSEGRLRQQHQTRWYGW
jgi:hypothetical protein